MGKTFAKVKLCHTNDFPSPQNEGIKRWIENNGGTFQQEIGADTTHLVCSTRAWKRYHPLVKEARRRNKTLSRSKKIKIVKYDWLDDSLSSKSRKPKDTMDYDWEQKRIEHKPALTSQQPCVTQVTEAKTAEKNVEKMDRKMIEFSKEIEEFETTMRTKGYHPYADKTGFLYLIVLVRRDVEKNLIERHRIKVRYSSASFSASTGTQTHSSCPISYFRFPAPYPFAAYPVVEARQLKCFKFKPFSLNRKLRVPIPTARAHCLQLFESDTIPRKYACYLSYTAGRPGVKRETQDLAPPGSDWEFAWAMFTKIFKLRTGEDWDARPDLSDAREAFRLQIDSGKAGVLKKYFEYVPPKLELPQGLRYNGGGTDGPAVETHDFNEEHTPKAIGQSILGKEGIKNCRRRLSVTLVMPFTATAAADDLEASARTPDCGW